jgi:serine/threonine protein kinase
MTVTDASLTRRSQTGSFDAPVDVETSRHSLASSGSGATSVAIPERFKILSQIGSGGMGIVFKVRDVETNEIVALKLLKPEIASDPRMREELREEVCLARKVTHKNVCRIHEFHRAGAAFCISMEYVHGETLLSKLRREGALPVRDAVDITRQICAGLREAHAHNIVHRDIKPANIMIDQSGVVKIMDFGIARLSEESGHGTRTIVGTPQYMAPEQIELKGTGPRTDIYSLGLLLYEIVTGSQAFTGESSIAVALKQVRESPQRPSEIISTLSPSLEAVILKCLRKNSGSRFASIDQLDLALCDATNGAATSIISQLRMDDAMDYAADKWRVLLPRLVRLGLELEIAATSLIQWLRTEWRRLGPVTASVYDRRKNRRIQIAATSTVAVLGVLLLANKQSDRAPTPPEAIFSQSLQNTEAAVASPMPVSPGTSSIDPDATTANATQPDPELGSVADRPDDERSTDVSSTVIPSSENVPQSNVPTARPEKRTGVRRTSVPFPPKAKPNAANLKPAVPERAPRPPSVDPLSSVSNSYSPSASISGPQPSVPATVSSNSTKPANDKPSSVSEAYLEVGSFGDTKWADDAVERLSQLGFHAICVHKSLLWKQSYHVQVGPYGTPDEIDDAQKRLTEQGFKSRAVK